MSIKHTPGPWRRKSIPGHLFEIHDADENPIFRIRGGMMPTLSDAVLIAAAPELLHALQRIADMRDRDGNAIEMHRDELRAIARTAIAKATGS